MDEKRDEANEKRGFGDEQGSLIAYLEVDFKPTHLFVVPNAAAGIAAPPPYTASALPPAQDYPPPQQPLAFQQPVAFQQPQGVVRGSPPTRVIL